MDRRPEVSFNVKEWLLPKARLFYSYDNIDNIFFYLKNALAFLEHEKLLVKLTPGGAAGKDEVLGVDEVTVGVGGDVVIKIRGALDKADRPMGLAVVGVANGGDELSELD